MDLDISNIILAKYPHYCVVDYVSSDMYYWLLDNFGGRLKPDRFILDTAFSRQTLGHVQICAFETAEDLLWFKLTWT